MKETYYLNGDILPTIPVPHDCVIKKVRLENQHIIFEFEDDISRYDSIKNFKPEVKSLTVKYHLLSDGDFSIYKWKKPSGFLTKMVDMIVWRIIQSQNWLTVVWNIYIIMWDIAPL